jgi:phosphoribosylformylglycinamidine synthase
LGFEVSQTDKNIRTDAYWFGEAQGRIVVSVKPSSVDSFLQLLNAQSVPFAQLGVVTSNEVTVEKSNFGAISDWKNLYDNSIGNVMSVSN